MVHGGGVSVAITGGDNDHLPRQSDAAVVLHAEVDVGRHCCRGICQGGHNGVGVVVHGSRVLLRLFRVCWSRKERMEEK